MDEIGCMSFSKVFQPYDDELIIKGSAVECPWASEKGSWFSNRATEISKSELVRSTDNVIDVLRNEHAFYNPK